ncbi:DUF6183 family protein [Actinomadura sp. HBU206391]|uniref:DUF6183 family protein n=1 Tax=Actinomadura sp. HBU206391 TaxID=2731692 RepID=UPI00164FDEE2|nr:DUF6183 family protein [Actinomadura sp. HBU206391]MBC6456537.1 hypothetical protein [Actinomadura sp. HBU206391]
MAALRRLSPTEKTVQRVLASFRNRATRPGTPRPVLKWLSSGRCDLVEELLLGLVTTRRPTYEMVKVFREVLQRLARMRGADSVAAVLRVADLARATAADRAADHGPNSPGPWLRNGDRDVAAWLCDGQKLDRLTPLFATAAPDDELAACLLHEAVLRHGDLGSNAEAVGFAARLRGAGHPLGHLPLRLLETERWYAPERRLEPQYVHDGYSAPYESRPRPSRAADGPPDLEVLAVEVEWPAARRAQQAFPDYRIGTDGEAESRRYLLDRPLAPEAFGASTLVRLPADCLSGAGPEQVRAWRAGTEDVWALLYVESLTGGPYHHGRGAAYSRAAAWEALAALCDATGEFADIEEAATGCTWLLFAADSGWFMQVDESLDIGIAALWPDHRNVVLLAATDSD